MAQYTLDDYHNLNAYADLKPEVVESKLEFLVKDIPMQIRPQIDRCYVTGFSTIFESLADSEQGSQVKVCYFTEDAQSPQVHNLAYPVFNIVLNYAGNLGILIRSSGAKDAKSDLIASAKKVSRYARNFDNPIPIRTDIKIFMKLMKESLRQSPKEN